MFGPKLSAMAARDLKKLGVELHMGSIVTEADPRGVKVKDHDGNITRYEAGTICGPRRPGAAAGRGGGQGHRRGDRTGRAASWSAAISPFPAIPTS